MFRRSIPMLVVAALAAGPLLTAGQATAQMAAIAEGELASGNQSATVEVTTANRKDGVLTISVRFTSTDGSNSGLTLYPSAKEGYENVYLVAANKKYFALKDSEGKPLMPERFYIAGKGKGLWSGKFPAPPPEVKAISLVIPHASPLDDIPITDK